jgi:hypothetical protein
MFGRTNTASTLWPVWVRALRFRISGSRFSRQGLDASSHEQFTDVDALWVVTQSRLAGAAQFNAVVERSPPGVGSDVGPQSEASASAFVVFFDT